MVKCNHPETKGYLDLWRIMMNAATMDFVRTASWCDISPLIDALACRIQEYYIKNGIVPECVVESFKHVQVNKPPGAASVVVVSPDGQRVLVIPKGKKYHQLTGGKIEIGETPVEAAVREVFEEAGVVLDPAQLKKVHVKSYKKGGQYTKHHFFRCNLKEEPVLGKRPRQPLWLPVEQAKLGKSYPSKVGYAHAVCLSFGAFAH